ncbi:MAG TPA: hypothetical protein VEC99_03310 [Clostridia bacterium]|nr:hypothetical protein [Clostridia bacterium]
MQHALDRALMAGPGRNLTTLDRERLKALARFLRSELSHRTTPDEFTFAGFGGQANVEPTYSLDIDLQQMLRALPAFEQWLATQKIGFEKKWQRLTVALESFADTSSGDLLPKQPPAEEFRLLQKIVSELLLHTESTLQT